MRKLLLTAALAIATLSTLSAPAQANSMPEMDGPCNAFNKAQVVKSFQPGTYSVRGPDVTAQVRVTRNKQGIYTFASHPYKGEATLYKNSKGYVLRFRDPESKGCTFSFATVKSGRLKVYSAYRLSMAVSHKFGQPKSSPIGELPSKSLKTNASLFSALAPHATKNAIIFTATLVPNSSR